MKLIIQNKLKEIELAHDIKILYSCESGSRAWGFASVDSDYDVRFIYVRSLDNYLSLTPQKDHITLAIDNDLDIYGWDVSKVLKLMVKSNTTPFEWLQSPIVYYQVEGFRDRMWEFCKNYFCAKSNIHHYLSMATTAISTLQDEVIGIKKLFYVLRPLLAAMWCAKNNQIAPMNIVPLMTLLSDTLKQKILALIQTKSTVDEAFSVQIDADLKAWINTATEYSQSRASTLSKRAFNIDQANSYFKELILK